MNKKRSTNSKEAARLKQRQRRMLTFGRMCRYGINNFSRNAWLTIAAIAVMSVTLLIIFVTISARQVLVDTVDEVSRKVNIDISLTGSISEEDAKEMQSRVEKLDNVMGVSFESAAMARQQQAERYKNDPQMLEAINKSTNEMPATLSVMLVDINDRASLEEFIKTDDLYEKYKNPRSEASLGGGRQQVIKKIGDWVRLASIGGSVATAVFVVISSLVVFNTIRMAIFNRKDEIQMMKLIGAERNFIRGPFIVEAVMYGFIAAIIGTVAGYGLLLLARDPMTKYGIPVDALLSNLVTYVGFVLLAMILVGSLIGVVSSWVATRKYLKL